jgi:predicted flap endonuclease-1-like 5' DNA nuclease
MKEVHMAKLVDIEGIGATSAAKLKGVGVDTVEELLVKGSTPKGRETIAESSGISPKLILEWVNLADLMRIKGVGEEMSDLLEEAGVDTVAELATRNATNLHQKLVEVNEAKSLVRQLPSEATVTDWVTQAKALPRVVQY